MIDPTRIKFSVAPYGEIILAYGDFSVEVCDSKENFQKFIDDLHTQLNLIRDEIKENYT